MIVYTGLGLLTLGFAAGEDVTADRFARLANAGLAEYRDVSFLYEGRLSSLAPGADVEDAMAGGGASECGVSYQGLYRFRDDHSILVDAVVNSNIGVLPTTSRRTSALIRGRITKVEDNMGVGRAEITEVTGTAGSLNEPSSPQRIVSLWLLKQFADPRSWNYVFLGWEEIRGHRCLKVQLDQGQGWPAVPDRPTYRLWIDVERGWHPLRVDYVEKGGVRMRADGIELAQVRAGAGKIAWFPVRGRLEMFSEEKGAYRTEAAGIETYHVLKDTLAINGGLATSAFDAKARSAEDRRIQAKTSGPRGTPDGIKRTLKENLEAAETQAKGLRAAASDEVSWWSGSGTPLVMGALGVAAVAFAILLRRRNA